MMTSLPFPLIRIGCLRLKLLEIVSGPRFCYQPFHLLILELSIIIPVAIVAVWLVILVIVAGFLCCQRRRNQVTLRTMYGPAYQIRPMAGAYPMRDKHYDNVSYEDHLEKAARMSAELNAYHSVGKSLLVVTTDSPTCISGRKVLTLWLVLESVLKWKFSPRRCQRGSNSRQQTERERRLRGPDSSGEPGSATSLEHLQCLQPTSGM